MRLLVSGGGTGGHIYPALATIKKLKQRDSSANILYVGSTRGLENKIIPEQDIPFTTINLQGLSRSISLAGLKHNIKTLNCFINGVHKAREIIKEFNPDIVLGTGGYVSSAVLFAAAKLNIPTIINEQNSVVGLTNKFLAHYVDKIAISFESVRKSFPKGKVVFTGNPRGQEVFENKTNFDFSEYGLDNNLPTVLIFGGSQGAPKINTTVIENLSRFSNKNYQLLFVTGKKRFDSVMEEINKRNITITSNISVLPYISNMQEILHKVSLIVSRSGATTLAEITALGKPSILIPSPNVTNDHQTKNALNLVSNGAASIIKESELNGTILFDKIDELMNDAKKLEIMSNSAKKLGSPNAADNLLTLMDEIIN